VSGPDDVTAAVPKAELHVHLEGTAPPELIARLAARNRLPVPDGLLSDDGRFHFDDFLHFLRQYDAAASVIRTAADYRDVTYAHLARCAAEGAVYVELIASPGHAASVGLADEEHWAAIAQGIDDARADHGIEARVLASVVRNLGVDAAERVVAGLVRTPHPYVTGFNMAGDEAAWPAERFTHVFAAAHHDAGLGCSVHAGEWAGPASVRAALALPGVTRISHGVRAIEDEALVAELAARGTVLEVCPTSNVALGVYPDLAAHPLRALHDAGVAVTLGSDDPPYFGTSIGREYAVAAAHLGFDAAGLLGLTTTAIRAAFAPEAVREALLARVAAISLQRRPGGAGPLLSGA
jgi:adenosine deaminase